MPEWADDGIIQEAAKRVGHLRSGIGERPGRGFRIDGEDKMMIRFDGESFRYPSVYREVAYPGLIRAALRFAAAVRRARPILRIMRLFGGKVPGAV